MSESPKYVFKNLLLYWKSIIWILFMLFVFLFPADGLSKAPSLPFLAESVHIIMFAILAWLLFSDHSRKTTVKIPYRKAGLFVLISGTILGIVIEVLQEISHLGRTAEMKDVLFDFAGIIITLGIIFFQFQLRRN